VQPVRRRIVEILKAQEGATVADLADHLEMAHVSVRHHLDILIGEDLVAQAGVRRHNGAGRPSQIYVLTDQAAALFPQRHAAFAADMLDALKARLSGQEVRNLLAQLGEKSASEAPTLPPGASLEEQLDATASYLTEQGYNAHWEEHDGRYELFACNCPYTGVADDHPELCLMDLTMMQHLMPDLIRLESRVLDGTPRCHYVVRNHNRDGAEA